MKSLIAGLATPQNHKKLLRWLKATEGHDRLVAIDSPAYALHLNRLNIPYVFVERPLGHNGLPATVHDNLYNALWEGILSKAKGYTHILSLDTDLVPEHDILELMEKEYDGGFLRHSVPYHNGVWIYETSCTFASVEDWRAALDLANEEGWTLFGMVGHPDKFPHRDVHLTDIIHYHGEKLDVWYRNHKRP